MIYIRHFVNSSGNLNDHEADMNTAIAEFIGNGAADVKVVNLQHSMHTVKEGFGEGIRTTVSTVVVFEVKTT